MLVDDMQAMGPVRLRDVDEAQALLVNLAKDLAAKGEIMISKNRATKSWCTRWALQPNILFDDDFAAPDRTRGEAATAAESRRRSPRPKQGPIATALPPARARPRPRATRRVALAIEQIDIAIGASPRGLARHREPDGNRGGRRRRRGRPQAGARTGRAPSRSARSWRSSPDCFSHLVATPHVVVRVNDALYDSAREKIERLAKQSGFEGRLVVLAEPDIAIGDCRIEWADGGVVRERSAIAAKIDELVGRYVAASPHGGDCEP